MKFFKKIRIEYIFLSLIVLFTIVICIFFYTKNKTRYLKFALLDIGQGDSIYIEAPNGVQILIDGGRDKRVISQLQKVMPLGDTYIDMIVITNPDADHDGGFIDVLNKYKVGEVLESGTTSPTKTYQKLEQLIKDKNIKKEIAHRGMKIILDKDKNIYFSILFPDRDVSLWSRNDGSIVGKLIYNKVSFMLMGDATAYTESIIAKNESPEIFKSNVLKLGHHGSHTSTSDLWLSLVEPSLALISAGRHNSYGHPHKDVLERLERLNIPVLGTYDIGTVLLRTDGNILFN